MDNSESEDDDFTFLLKEFKSNTKGEILKSREKIFEALDSLESELK